MKSDNALIRIFLLVVGNALALYMGCLSLITARTNFLGWFLLVVSIAYGAGGVFYLWLYRNESNTIRSEVGNRSFWWIVPGFLAVFLGPLVEYFYFPPVLPRSETIELLGLIIILAGFSLRIWTRFALGKYYSGYLRIKVGHRLIKGGPYRFVRHPGYAGFILIALGIAIGYSSLFGLAAILILLIPGLLMRISIEEKLLLQEFGDSYPQYALQTKSLIPGIW